MTKVFPYCVFKIVEFNFFRFVFFMICIFDKMLHFIKKILIIDFVVLNSQ